MATRDEFLRLLWDECINAAMGGHWIENTLREAERDPHAPFADIGPALQRLLAIGAARDDLSRLVRWASYEAAFGVLSSLEAPGIDAGASAGLYTELLAADPSGHEGRPESWPLE